MSDKQFSCCLSCFRYIVVNIVENRLKLELGYKKYISNLLFSEYREITNTRINKENSVSYRFLRW